MNDKPEGSSTIGAIIKEATERHQAFIKVDLKASAEESHHRAKQKVQRRSL